MYSYIEPNSNKIINGTHNYTEKYEAMTFLTDLRIMFWAVLNPGPDPDTISEKGLAGIMANILFAVYQIILAILLLNLLIAMMNSTMQKIEDKKLLYWKFVRTSVWLDFTSTKYFIPPPIILLAFVIFGPIHIIGYIIYTISTVCRKCSNPRGVVNNTSRKKHGSVRKKCVMDPIEGERRKEHAMLLHTLIKRYLQNDVEKNVQPFTYENSNTIDALGTQKGRKIRK